MTTSKEYLKTVLGGNMNTSTLTTFAIEEIMTDFANKHLKEQLALCSVINWVAVTEKEPEDFVEYYFTCSEEGNIEVNLWYEGDCFETCSGGHWADNEGCEIKNITHWAKLTKPPCI